MIIGKFFCLKRKHVTNSVNKSGLPDERDCVPVVVKKREEGKAQKILKLVMIILMISGLTFATLNFISIENKAVGGLKGTIDLDTGECVPPGLNCNIILPLE